MVASAVLFYCKIGSVPLAGGRGRSASSIACPLSRAFFVRFVAITQAFGWGDHDFGPFLTAVSRGEN